MPRRWSLYNRLKRPEPSSLHKLLGDLEVQVMERMWRLGSATVREVAADLQQERAIAYTTVMTVMSHLADKGLLTRTSLDRKTHLYRVDLTREQFLERASRQMVDALVTDFGELALAHFADAVEQVDPERLQRLLKRLSEPEPADQVEGRSPETGEPEPGAQS